MTRLSHLILLFSAVAMTAALPHPGCAADCAESYISRNNLGHPIARDPSAGTADSLVNNAARQAGPVADKGASLSLNLIPLGQVLGNIVTSIFGSTPKISGDLVGDVANKAGNLVGNVANKAGALIGAVAGQAGAGADGA